MKWCLAILPLITASALTQGKPIYHWHFDAAHLAANELQPIEGERTLRIDGRPSFYGSGKSQCLLRSADDPIATVDAAMPSIELPQRAITVEAWVAIDVAQEWGGILGAIRDNGEDERGWLLGFRNRDFSFALSSDKKRRLTYLAGGGPFELGLFYHVVGTYDGENLRLYVDGALAAEDKDQSGPIFYAKVHKFVAGAYQDSNESYKLHGAIKEIRVFDSALSARRIKALYRKGHKSVPVAPGPTFTAVPKKAIPELAALQPKINSAIDRGVEHILRRQNRDGSWDFKLATYRNGVTALTVYTLVKSNVPVDHPAIVAALRFLAARDPVKVYSLGCQLLALGGVGREENREWARRLTDKLIALESRVERGGWAYPEGAVDLSNSQFAALGFYGASQLGIEIDPEIWRRMIKKTLAHQVFLKLAKSRGRGSRRTTSGSEKVGGYSYFIDGRQYSVSGSMTTAGLCVLALADRLAKAKLGARHLRTLHRSKNEALSWLSMNFTVTTNPGYPSTTYYYLYGVERVGALLGLEEFGGVPWYRAGAEWMVGKQAANGGWGNLDETCFVLLFLTRSTAPITGQATRKAVVWKTEGDVRLAVTGRVKCSMWISDFDPKHKSKPLHIRQVRYEIDGTEVAVIAGDPKRPWTIENYLYQHRFAAPGVRKLGAIIELESGATLRSPILEVTADYDMEGWMQGNLDRMAPNLLFDADGRLDRNLQIEASSSAKDRGPKLALDGMEATAWVCATGAETPVLKLSWQKPIRANRIVLSPVDCRLPDTGRHDHVRRLSLTINRTKMKVTCTPDAMAPIVVDLRTSRLIRSLEIEILASSPGGSANGRSGFAEVALQLRPKSR